MGRRLLITLLALAIVLALAVYRENDPWQAPTGPRPWLTASDVVRLQLEALRRNAELHDDRGIRIALRFTAPSIRARSDPAAAFAGLLHRPGFRAMLHHRQARIVARVERDDRAAYRVWLRANDDRRAGNSFLFVLSRQALPECQACWVVDVVHPWPERPKGIDV